MTGLERIILAPRNSQANHTHARASRNRDLTGFAITPILFHVDGRGPPQ